MEPTDPPRPQPRGDLHIDRPALTTAMRKDMFSFTKPVPPTMKERMFSSLKKKTRCSSSRIKNFLMLRFPILSWLPEYNIKTDLMGDCISGFTVAIMHIPQGMAYAMLAALDPIVGIYMAFFPVLIYAFFGTSRHCSMGTFAVVCLMTGKVVNELSSDPHPTMVPLANTTGGIPNVDYPQYNQAEPIYSPLQVATLVSFAVGFWEIVLGLLQLGSLCVFLSDMLVSGFTTGAAIHVMSSQVKHLFGISLTRYNGPFKLIRTYKELFEKLLTEANASSIVISIICMTVLALNNEKLKPRLKKYTQIPLPIELIVVVIGTAASHFGHFYDNYGVKVVGDIPTGLPSPALPPLDLFPSVLKDGFVIAIVSYTVSYSMSKMFGKKHGYPVDATQELYAHGISNIFGSFFSCAPMSASLSRSLIQETVGGKTQITSLVTCSILVFILLFIGPLFESLPTCVLASIILVALKGMFLQTNDMIAMWKKSRLEASVWIITFLSVVIIDIDYGLVIGVIMSLFVLLAKNQTPACTRLGNIPNTDLYLDVNMYDKAIEVPGVMILQYYGALHFANRESFKSDLMKQTGVDPSEIQRLNKEKMKAQAKNEKIKNNNNVMEKKNKHIFNRILNGTKKMDKGMLVPEFGVDSCCHEKNNYNSNVEAAQKGSQITASVTCIILDFSGISYIDISSGNFLANLYKEYKSVDVEIVLAGITERTLAMLEITNIVTTLPEESLCHSVHDAVTLHLSGKRVEGVETELSIENITSVNFFKPDDDDWEPPQRTRQLSLRASSNGSRNREKSPRRCSLDIPTNNMMYKSGEIKENLV